MPGQVLCEKILRSQCVRRLQIDGHRHYVEAHRLWVREQWGGRTEALHEWPVPQAEDWSDRVNAVTSKKEQSRWEMSWEVSLSRSQPFGDDGWTAQTVKALGLEHTVRGEGENQYAKAGEA